jgi:hypothetical protein
VQDLRGPEKLLGGGEDFVVFVDGGAEFFLDVTDALGKMGLVFLAVCVLNYMLHTRVLDSLMGSS